MGFFNNFPYTNFHEINLDWIIDAVKNCENAIAGVPAEIQKAVAEKINEFNIPEEIGKVLVDYGLALSVKNYGAVGDGVTDDSEAFQKWLEDVVTNDTVGFIPPGEYFIRSGVIGYRTEVNNHRWSIMGAGTKATVLKFEYTYNNCFDLRYCNNFSISDLTIKCPGLVNQTYGNGIYLVECNNAFFSNIDIVNCSRGGVLSYSSDPENIFLDNLKFDNVNIYGVENQMPFSDTDPTIKYPCGMILENVTNSSVQNCYVENIKWFTFEFKDHCRNSQFVNCVANNCVTACYCGGESKSGAYAVGCKYDIKCFNTSRPVVLGYNTGNQINVQCFNDVAIDGDTLIRADYSNNNNITVKCVNFSGTGIDMRNGSTGNIVKIELTGIKLPYTALQCATVSGNLFDIGDIGESTFRYDRLGDNMAKTFDGIYGNGPHIFSAGMLPIIGSSDFDFSGTTCSLSFDAEASNPVFTFRNAATNGYIQMEFDVANKRIRCRFNDGSTSKIADIAPA